MPNEREVDRSESGALKKNSVSFAKRIPIMSLVRIFM
jgi:hypothetical protein